MDRFWRGAVVLAMTGCSSPAEQVVESLSAHAWRLTEVDNPLDGEFNVSAADWSYVRSYSVDAERGDRGSVFIDGEAVGLWYLAEDGAGSIPWTLDVRYGWYIVDVSPDGGTETFVSGVKALTESQLELHHDVGIPGDSRIDRYIPE